MILISKKSCPYSDKLKRYMNKHKLKYVLIEVSDPDSVGGHSYDYAKGMLKVSTFPTLINGRKRIVGSDVIKTYLEQFK